MTIERARIIKGAFAGITDRERRPEPLGRRIPGELLDARDEAARILEDARTNAERIILEANEAAGAVGRAAAKEAREQETARLAAGFLALRAESDRRAEADLDRAMELAVLLAERLVGEALRIDPSRIAELAAAALHEARGARRIRVEACPEDIPAVRAVLGSIGQIADVEADPSLKRGSLLVHTDLGRVDARLEPQLARLAVALREALG